MALTLNKKEEVINAIDDLPPESVSELMAFIEYLRFKSEKRSPRLIKLGGLWRDFPPISDDDIAEARREMWGRFEEREL